MGLQRLRQRPVHPVLQALRQRNHQPHHGHHHDSRGHLQPALPGAVLRQGERPWMRQLNAPEGAVIGVSGKA